MKVNFSDKEIVFSIVHCTSFFHFRLSKWRKTNKRHYLLNNLQETFVSHSTWYLLGFPMRHGFQYTDIIMRFSSMISIFEEQRVYRRTTSLREFWFVIYIGTLQFVLHFILHDTLESPIIWLIMIVAYVCTPLYLNQIGRLQDQLWKSSEWA